MKKLVLSAAILPLSLSAFAGSYQFQGNLGYADSETGDVDGEATSVAVTAYLNAVDDSKGPYAEAAFLNKASSLTLGYDDSEVDSSIGSADSDAMTAAITYVIPNSHFILGLSYVEGETEGVDYDGYSLTGGKYINDNVNVTLTYASTDSDIDAEADAITLATHVVSNEGAAGERVALDFALSRTDADYAGGSDIYSTVFLGGTFYANNQLGISFDWNIVNGGLLEGQTMAAGVEYFFIPQLAAALTYSYFSPDEDGLKSTDTISLSLTGRF